MTDNTEDDDEVPLHHIDVTGPCPPNSGCPVCDWYWDEMRLVVEAPDDAKVTLIVPERKERSE